jgi:hypothetical protein
MRARGAPQHDCRSVSACQHAPHLSRHCSLPHNRPPPASPTLTGEYPLSFAACTGQKDIVAHLKRHGAKVNEDTDVQ